MQDGYHYKVYTLGMALETSQREKALYRDNDLRQNLDQLKTPELDQTFVNTVKSQAQSVACLISKDRLLQRNEGGWQLQAHTPTLAHAVEEEFRRNTGKQETMGEHELFCDEYAAGFGTAFLVGKKYALTAAHCVCFPDTNTLDERLIAISRLVFGFQNKSSIFEDKAVYQIKKVVSHQFIRIRDKRLNFTEWNDWALLELDREIPYTPLRLNMTEKVADRIELYMLGHPNGLPVKLTKNGTILKNKAEDFFECNLDAFGGNSGSPVFDRSSGQVVGILCSGQQDYQITTNYRNTGTRRIQAHQITKQEIGLKGFEVCQRMHRLRFLVDFLGIEKSNQESPELIIQALKNQYLTQNTIPRLLHSPLPIQEVYTELVLLNKAKEDKKEEQKSFEEHRINSWEDIQGTKEPIKLDKLFDQKNKRILILGRAGIGKSTLCQYIAHQWAEDKLWPKKFDALFWIPLRKLQNAHSLETITSFLFRLYPIDVANYITKNPERILFVLDGLDEVSLVEGSLQKKIVDELLNLPYWIMTSRPHAAHSIQSDATIENVGFASKTIDFYIQKSFPKNSKAVIQKIRQNPIIFGLCHVPINLELVCSILSKSKGDISFIHSMTDLYEELTLTLQRRFLEKIGKSSAWTWEKGDIEGDQELAKVFSLLESIAWEGLRRRELSFSFNQGNMNNLYLKSYPPSESHMREPLFIKICESGFLQSNGKSTQFLRNDYSFLHLTFQEFFAARYLAKLLQENLSSARQCIQEVKFDPRYKVVMWFMAGLLKDDPENLNAFFDILDKPKDAVGFYSATLKVRCLEESCWSEQLVNLKTYEKEITFWCSLVQNSQVHKWLLQFLVEAFEISPQGTKRLFMPILSSCLKNGSRDVKSNVDLLGQVGQADPKFALSLLAQALKDKADWVRESAAKALGKIGQVDLQQILPLLEKALEDKNSDVRRVAISVLGEIGQVDLQQILPLLEKALENKNSDVRRAAISVLGEIGQVDLQQILPLLEKALEDEDEYVRKAAISVLGEIRQVEPQRALHLLEKALENKNPYVRRAAISVLGEIRQVEPQRALHLLEKALEDKNPYVRRAAISVLGEIGQVEPQRALHLLEKALKDEYVRKVAIEALGKIGQAEPQRALHLLEKALEDKNPCLRQAAIEALGKIWQIEPQRALPLFEKALEDEDEYVRKAAISVLGEIRQVEPQRALHLLEKALENKNSDVRRAAISVLGEIRQVEPQRALHLLEKALEDKNPYVRRAAISVLGEIGQVEPQRALHLLEKALKDEYVRKVAIEALGKIGQAEPQQALPLLEKALEDKNPCLRQAAIEALGKIWQVEPQRALPLLEKALEDEDEYVRKAAISVLGEIRQVEPQRALHLLEKALENKNPYVRRAAISVLGEIRQVEPQRALHLLEKALEDKNPYVRRAAISVLGEIGQVEPQRALHLLEKALEDKNPYVRRAAISVLGEIGQAEPQRALLLLEKALNDKGKCVRKSAVKALGEIGQVEPQRALKLLGKALQDQDKYFRKVEVEIEAFERGQADLKFPLDLVVQPNDYKPMHVSYKLRHVRSATDALKKIGQANPGFVLPFSVGFIENLSSSAFRYYDLSSCLQQEPSFLSYLEYEEFTLLNATPLSSLVTHCLKTSPACSAYLEAIVMKCLQENQAIFFENGSLCFHEKGQICRLNFPQSELCIVNIEKLASTYPSEYPEFFKEEIVLEKPPSSIINNICCLQ